LESSQSDSEEGREEQEVDEDEEGKALVLIFTAGM